MQDWNAIKIQAFGEHFKMSIRRKAANWETASVGIGICYEIGGSKYYNELKASSLPLLWNGKMNNSLPNPENVVVVV